MREWVEGDAGVASAARRPRADAGGGASARAEPREGARVDGDARWRWNDGGFFVFEREA